MDKVITRTIEEVRKDAEVVITELKEKYQDTKFYLDVEFARKVIAFISILKHTGGKLGGVNFQILPFQTRFLLETLAVKQKSNDKRKHKTSILFVPRKQGKTELLSALNLLMFFMDKEIQKEQYVIASETQQASILYNAVTSMLRQSPTLLKKVVIYKSTKTIEKMNGNFSDIFKVLTSNAETKDGL